MAIEWGGIGRYTPIVNWGIRLGEWIGTGEQPWANDWLSNVYPVVERMNLLACLAALGYSDEQIGSITGSPIVGQEGDVTAGNRGADWSSCAAYIIDKFGQETWDNAPARQIEPIPPYDPDAPPTPDPIPQPAPGPGPPSQQPPTQPTTGRPTNWLDLADALATLYQRYLEWRRVRRNPYNVSFQIPSFQLPRLPGSPPATVPATGPGGQPTMPWFNTSIFGGESGLDRLLQTGANIASMFVGPQAHPGGAPIQTAQYQAPVQQAGWGPFPLLGSGQNQCPVSLASPFAAGGQRGARAKTHVVADPITGRAVWFKPAGRPLLWSGDLSAAKRVRKVAARARRSRGGR